MFENQRGSAKTGKIIELSGDSPVVKMEDNKMAELRDDELEQVSGGGIIDSIMEGYILTWDAKYKYLDPVLVLNRADLGVGYVQDLPDEKLNIYVVFFRMRN